MTLQNKIQEYINEFDFITREDDTRVTILKTHEGKLHDAIMHAHGEDLPRDFIFDTFLAILEKLTEYEINTIDNVEDYRSEIVDGLVDIYTNDLTAWLASDIRNVYYLTQALEENPDIEDGFKLLAIAQYTAIDEVYSYVVGLLTD